MSQILDPEKKAQHERLHTESAAFRQLTAEHAELERQIGRLSAQRHPSAEELTEIAELKRRKLTVKDTMSRMLFDDEINQRRKARVEKQGSARESSWLER